MFTVERLRHKISPLEDKTFTESIIPRLHKVDLTPYMRRYKGMECVVLTPSEAWEALFPRKTYTLHDLTVLGRSLQALLWERSYLRGNLVFTKTMKEVKDDGF
jgi:hypothetical protein